MCHSRPLTAKPSRPLFFIMFQFLLLSREGKKKKIITGSPRTWAVCSVVGELRDDPHSSAPPQDAPDTPWCFDGPTIRGAADKKQQPKKNKKMVNLL